MVRYDGLVFQVIGGAPDDPSPVLEMAQSMEVTRKPLTRGFGLSEQGLSHTAGRFFTHMTTFAQVRRDRPTHARHCSVSDPTLATASDEVGQ
jgi:hypothetical protein